MKRYILTVIVALLSITSAAEAKVKYCQGGRFKPCVCWQNVSKDVSYRPKYAKCGGKAAILTRGKYLGIFSAVVRDRENRDRWPVSGFNGCSVELSTSEAPPTTCSAFKAQKVFMEQTEIGPQKVTCLGAPGTSPLFRNVVRITAKIADIPNSTNDPLARWCLRSPRLNLN